MPDIQHQIDFIPRAPLPNLSHYWINPKESQILQKNVEKLLQKGNIRKSISSVQYQLYDYQKRMDHSKCAFDSRVINKIIIQYIFSLPKLDDLLD